MGKVYEALRRAEEQRARRASEATAIAGPLSDAAAPEMPIPPRPEPAPASALPAPAPARLPEKPQRLGRLRRLFSRKAAKGVESPGALNKRRIVLLQPESYVAEQFRSLRGRIDSIAAQQPICTIAVTSALAGEGKTTAATNLAIVTAMSVGRKVLLVDCDLRRPRIHQALGLRVEAGLAEVLLGQVSIDDAIVRVDGTSLDVLPVRGLPGNPSELLASDRMKQLVQEAAARYDRVILDVPPALGLPEAKSLCDDCDGIVFVVRSDETPSTDVESALEVLDRRRLLGLVLNGVEQGPDRYGYVGD